MMMGRATRRTTIRSHAGLAGMMVRGCAALFPLLALLLFFFGGFAQRALLRQYLFAPRTILVDRFRHADLSIDRAIAGYRSIDDAILVVGCR